MRRRGTEFNRDKRNILLVDSRISEYAPFDLEFGRKGAGGYHWGKLIISRTWGKSFSLII